MSRDWKIIVIVDKSYDKLDVLVAHNYLLCLSMYIVFGYISTRILILPTTTTSICITSIVISYIPISPFCAY